MKVRERRSARWHLEIDSPKGGAGGTMKRYAVVFEKADSNWAAYVPDLPGCITTGPTLDETKRNIREAIELHLEAMREVGEPIPPPSADVDFVELETVA
jgi:predicted RNase H-like HicB family nuclease